MRLSNCLANVLLGTMALTACTGVYTQPYKLHHGTGTWETGKSHWCTIAQNEASCFRKSANHCGGSFRTATADDGCSDGVLERERAYYPSVVKDHGGDTSTMPLLGVALSGGGARSASTSIGFLRGLDHTGILARVDIISSVSGGSYASYWFFSHLYNAPKLEKDDEQTCLSADRKGEDRYKDYYERLFDPTKRFQRQVEYNSRLATKSQSAIGSKFEMALEVFSWLPTIPYHWLVAGLFDQKKNRNPLTHYYHAGLERAYGLYPLDESCPSPKTFRNDAPLHILDKPVCLMPRFEAFDPRPDEIRQFHISRIQAFQHSPCTSVMAIPPFWVINATAAYGGRAKMFRSASFGGFSHDLRDTVFEFTPFHYGSPRFGYWEYPAVMGKTRDSIDTTVRVNDGVDSNMLKYGRLVGASGAAVDGINPTCNVLLDIFNGAIGRYIDNPNVDDSVRRTHSWLPFPFYGFHRAHHDKTSPKIYLTDGGHSENLGLYSLIRRRVKNIIVLDAEHEPRSRNIAPDDGNLYRKASFESLQEIRCRLYAENGLHLMIARWGDNPLSKPFFPSDVATGDSNRTTPCNQTFSREQLDFDVRQQPFPYLWGWICLNGARDCVDDANRLKILYVKLALDQALAESADNRRYGQAVQKYLERHKKGDFPHDSTADIFYQKEQYEAYRDLGYDLAKCIRFFHNDLEIDNGASGCDSWCLE